MSRFGRLPIFLGTCFLLAGCYKNPFVRPWSFVPATPAEVWVPDAKETQKVSCYDVAQRLQIPPPDEVIALGELFEIALSNNPDTTKTWAEARQAAASYAQSLSTFLPTLTFDGEYQNYKTASVFNGQIFISKAGQIGPELEFSWLLWDFGARYANAESYYQTLQNVNWLHNESLQNVMQSVAGAYYDYLYSKALLTADEADLKNAKEVFDAAIEKFHLGIFNETDLMQTKTNYLQKKVVLTGQKATVDNSLVQLMTVLGIPANVAIMLGNFPNEPAYEPFCLPLNKLIDLATNNRPDFLAAKADALSKEAALKKAKLDLLPQLNFSGSVGQQWFSGNLTDNGDYMVQFNLTFPIFTGFYKLNEIKKREAALAESKALVRKAELDMIQRVKTSHTNFFASKEQLLDAKSYLESADVEYSAMLERYKQGIVTILDLLNAEAYLSDARASYAQAQKGYFMSIINVAYATGMLTNSIPWKKS